MIVFILFGKNYKVFFYLLAQNHFYKVKLSNIHF